MTAKERARLHGFWTHKETGQRIAISRVTLYGEAHARKVNSLGHEVGPKEIMLVRDLKEDYVKGMI
ncbi:hypothetical protein COL32_30415 [Bacillus pseudomycoides]|uniref:hypothetical protein n=1 Tax=Bacillus pseudomycoides TaxID=64104 RepID=UPI000BF60765|nr:hypothetical protein [Bacillus pseudomycoides]PFW86546.1 hypothetical protein COL29_30160 [Bacillus pseudomycoides]PFX35451.1 hypothetical protein COL32_30415 [Bacillus pseudomycoides]